MPAKMSGYTKVDNWLFDNVLPSVNAPAFKVISVALRCTAGWHKDCDTISVSRFQELCGFSGRSMTQRAIEAALDSGFLVRERTRIGYSYRTRIGYRTVPESGIADAIIVPDSGTATVPESGNTKGKSKERTTSSSTPVESLMRRFTQITAISPPHDTTDAYKDKWLKPLKDLIAFNAELAERRLEEAINILRSKRFTIASPASIYKTAVNWFPESAVKPNGADAAWSQLWTGDGWKAPQDSRGKATVKAMGGMPRFKNSQARERSFLEKEFKSAY